MHATQQNKFRKGFRESRRSEGRNRCAFWGLVEACNSHTQKLERDRLNGLSSGGSVYKRTAILLAHAITLAGASGRNCHR